MLMYLCHIPFVVKEVVVLLEGTGTEGGDLSRDKIWNSLNKQKCTANMLLTIHVKQLHVLHVINNWTETPHTCNIAV